ncbi:hypothetical protein H3146_05780 [Streptomyces sp. OF3]|uniref:Uncharacterized protein n=1 Tax=Streptomyces alkaliterrae TaxID=2213162 RepID=A0A7W3WIB5_9ACTN|nr:hypothetical protein [Streptomyces alkaliterrae]MBB1252876.1 hypothetical protein [Streptomyces alkaliterrae]
METVTETRAEGHTRTTAALTALVRGVNAAGTSFQAMADRAKAAGLPLSKPYFQKLATGAVTTSPTEPRLRAIAAGTGRPLRVVQEAAALQYLGYEASGLAGYDEDTRVIVAHLAGMTPAARRRWRVMIEAADQITDQE